MSARNAGIAVGLALAATLAAGLYVFREQVQIDACLDGGGRWNDAAKSCSK